MYAHCHNNPNTFADDEGQVAILATLGAMAIGTTVSLVTQYAGDILANVLEGKSGADIFKPTSSLGDYVTSALTGALCSIPGVNTVVPITCDIAGPAVKQVIDSVHQTHSIQFELITYAGDVVNNIISSGISKAVFFNTPKYIRDIKESAHSLGIKETKKLNSYLNTAKRTALINNQFVNFAQEFSFRFATKTFGIAKNKLISLY